MEIIDNINRLLGDNLKQSIVPGAKLKIAASCFSIYAFEALKAELEQIEWLEFHFYQAHIRLRRGDRSSPARAPRIPHSETREGTRLLWH